MSKKLVTLGFAAVVLVVFVAGIALFSLSASAVRAEEPAQQWEYMTMNYSQGDAFTIDDPNARYEFAFVDKEPYATNFLEINVGRCGDFNMGCQAENFRGLVFFLDELGADGWELISTNNNSVSSYSLELFFKRPLSS
jgi:hypothetical protein